MTTLITLFVTLVTTQVTASSDWSPAYQFTNWDEVKATASVGLPLDPAEAKKEVETFTTATSPAVRLASTGLLFPHKEGKAYASAMKLTAEGELGSCLELHAAGRPRPALDSFNGAIAQVVIDGKEELWFRCHVGSGKNFLIFFLGSSTDRAGSSYQVTLYDVTYKAKAKPIVWTRT